MVIEKINIASVAVLEAENHSPVPANDNSPEALTITSHRMQPEAWHVHVIRHGARIEAGEHALCLSHQVGPYLAAVAALKEALQSAMFEVSDRALLSSA